ncbi:MAG TPA: LLM class flavin-dependent oxidoreductase [Nitrososphaerales archaeon]|nr:LLM class flavin-dependent oxidoreductase [Nitrososphaerales archaeon]
MRFGAVIDDISPTDSLQRGIRAERLGFDSLWFSDHLMDTGGIRIDPWTTMGAISASTKKIEMCCAVSDVQRIHPAKLAHMVATLDDLSKGRTLLGVGAGEAMNLVPFGIEFDSPKDRVERLGEAVQVAKLLWSSSSKNPVSFQGRFFSLEDAWLDIPISSGIPKVIVGALGGRSALEVAGKYGDGWVSWLNSPETFRKKLEIARSSATTTGMSTDNFRACVWVYTILTSDSTLIRKALNRAKRGLLAEGQTLKMMGFDRPKELGKTYQNMLLSEEGAKKIPSVQDSVPDDIVLQIVAAGDSSQIIERIEEFGKAGATEALIHFVGDDKNQMEDFSKEVLNHFHSK